MERNGLIQKVTDGIYKAVTLAITRGNWINRFASCTRSSLENLQSKDWIARIVMYAAVDDAGVRAHGQVLIDFTLKIFARILLNDLFKEQKNVRERIERNTIRAAEDSVPRNLMCDLLSQEKAVAEAIEIRKREFDEILAAAKELGFEVFERNENRFHLYLSLEVSLRETANNIRGSF